MSYMGSRILSLMEQEKMSEEKLAQITKIGTMTLRRYILGYSAPNQEDALKLSEAFKVPVSYIMGSGEDVYFSEPISRIPVFRDFNEKLSGEKPSIESPEYISGNYHVKDVKSCYFIVADSDDMIYSKIGKGDKVLISPEESLTSGDLAAVRFNGKEPLIRKVYFEGKNIILTTTGPNVEEIVLDAKEDKVEFLGRVVFTISYPE